MYIVFFFCKQNTAYELRISDWSSDVCSSDLDLDAREIIRVRGDRGIIAEDVAHTVAELQRVEPAHVEPVDAGVAAIGIGENAGGIFHRVADADRDRKSVV